MKRFIQVSSILVSLMVLITACSNSLNQTNTGQANDSVNEKVEQSQDEEESGLPESSEGAADDSEAEDTQQQQSNSAEQEDTQQQQPNSAVQEDGVVQAGKYSNRELGFTLNIPEHLKEYLVIESGKFEGQVDHSVDFYYVNGDVNEFLFSILVYDHVIEENQWQDPLWKYLGTANGRTYACAIVGEPSEALLEEKNQEHFEMIKIIINEELLDVLDTIQYTVS